MNPTRERGWDGASVGTVHVVARRPRWVNSTHDWSATVDVQHLARIRADPTAFAAGAVVHLVLEVLAYADDEAEDQERRGRVSSVTVHPDGSVAVTDDGRGTDTRFDDHGEAIRKPVMATRDLRYFDTSPPVLLPVGSPRRGLSVVAALSRWLVHTNRRPDGSWTQTYDHALPTTGLTPVPADGSTGTTVHFLPDTALLEPQPGAAVLDRIHTHRFSHLAVQVCHAADRRPSPLSRELSPTPRSRL